MFKLKTLMIEPTNRCNLKCPMCHVGAGKLNRNKRDMSFEEFKKIIDQSKFVKNILLWNLGEPFLNKELLMMTDYAFKNGKRVTTSTNGEFFYNEQFCKNVVQSGFRRLIVCLDGADQEILSKYRIGSNFKKIVEGIKMLCKFKKQLRLVYPIIELQFIVMKHNQHQRQQMRKIAEDLNVDVYKEKAMAFDINDVYFQQLAKELLPTDNKYCEQDGRYVKGGKIIAKCSFIKKIMVINSNGLVVPCCYDFYSKFIMGNVFEENLFNIWEGKKYQEFRKQVFESRESMPFCSTCSEGREGRE